MLWESKGRSSFTASDLLVICTALARLSKTVPTSSSELDNLVQVVYQGVETLCAATASAQKKVEQQKTLVSFAMKSTSSILNDVVSFRRRFSDAGTPDEKLFSSASVALNQIALATAELLKTRAMSSTQSREVEKIAKLKMSSESLEDNVAVFEGCKELLKSKLASATSQSTCIGQLFDGMRVKRADLKEYLGVRDAVIQSIVEDLCAMLEASVRNLAENLRASRNISVSRAFVLLLLTLSSLPILPWMPSLCVFLGGAVSEEGGHSTKGVTATDPSLFQL